jgi:hypothetical protein
MAWDGDRLVVAGGAMGGLRLVSAAEPAAPALAGALDGLGAVSHLAAWQADGKRTVLYAADPVGGLRALDLRAALARSSGMLLGERIDLPRAGAMAVSGPQLVVGGASVLRPFDLATPGSPRPLPTVPVGQVAETMATDGERFYAGFGDLGLAALEGGPGDLHETARLDQPLVWRVDRTADGTGLIGQGLGALHELDGRTLQVRRSWPLPGQPDFRVNRADSLAVDGDLVHLGVASYTHTGVANSFNDRLMSLRPGAAGAIAEPAGRVDGIIGSRAGRVLARDGVILVAGDRQVTVLGMAPGGPLMLGQWASPGSASDLLWLQYESDDDIGFDDDLVFVADGEAGLAVLILDPRPVLPSPTPTATATLTATPRGTRPTPTTDRRVLLPHLPRQATARPTARR